MGLSTIVEIRELAGIEATYERNVKLQPAADGARVDFYIPQRFLVDSNDDELVTIADIVVYDDDVSVAITAVNVGLNKITLTAAPLAGSVMTADYAWSPVKESVIAALLVKIDDEIQKEYRTANVATSTTDYHSGNGVKTIFFFRKIPCVSLTAHDVDGATGLTIGTDYWLQPDPTRAMYIEFKGAPANDKQNVQLTYDYGETQYLLAQLSKYMVAREVIMYHIGKTSQTAGVYSGAKYEQVFTAEQRRLTQIRRMDERIEQLEIRLGGQVLITIN